jgi:uncharacterized protein with GYD domain
MATFIALGNFTEQGIKSVKDTTKRSDAIRELAGRYGVTMKQIYWTLGRYDVVTIVEAPNDEAVTAFALAIGAAGNVRTESLRAFSKEEMSGILGKL